MEDVMMEAGLQELKNYVSHHHNTVAQYIATRLIIDLCLVEKQRPETRVAMWWWEKEGLDLEGMWMVAWEAEQKKDSEERDGTETEM